LRQIQERRHPHLSSYFDNAQDEATGGEGHSNTVPEEEKETHPEDILHNFQIDQ
jgi:hypothetical protein